MKKISFALVSILLLFIAACSNTKPTGQWYKARLEIAGICMNYTIAVLDPVDTSLVVPSWSDPQTKKTYKNVFALGSQCNFPASIKEGDEFYFRINPEVNKDCAVCLAFYPVPEKSLSIIVSTTRPD